MAGNKKTKEKEKEKERRYGIKSIKEKAARSAHKAPGNYGIVRGL